MKVLHLIAPVAFGGGESLLVNLIQERRPELEESLALIYQAAPFEARLAALQVPSWRLRDRSLGHGIPKWQMGLDTLNNLRLVGKLRQIVQTAGIDLVHVHGYPACILFYLLRQLIPIPGIYTHHFYRQPPSAIARRLLTPVYNCFDACTGVSNLVSQSMQQGFPNLKTQFQTIYNCIGRDFYQPVPPILPNGPPWPPDKTIFIQVARFAPFKNHHLVVAALAKLPPATRSQLLVVFVGEGREKPRIRQQVAACGLEAQVWFLGAVPYEQIPGLLAAADFGLFPSENEGFGIGAVECLAAGLPVLSLDTELMREIVGPAGVQISRDRLDLGFELIQQRAERLKPLTRLRAAQFHPSRIKDQYWNCYKKLSRFANM